jgi:hypothetical protein
MISNEPAESGGARNDALLGAIIDSTVTNAARTAARLAIELRCGPPGTKEEKENREKLVEHVVKMTIRVGEQALAIAIREARRKQGGKFPSSS